MLAPHRIWTMAVLVCLSGAGATEAQEFRVYTRIFNESSGTVPRGEARHPIVSRSLTFFHAGKAYDYIEAAGEVIIFEPSARRFTILNASRMMATEITFDEIEQRFSEAKVHWGKNLQRNRNETDATVLKTISLVQFQLDPRFEETYDATSQSLNLRSRPLTYAVRCAEAKTPNAATAYLRYTDWTAQLNYVLHPEGMLPGPRLVLNERLRERNLLPTEVALSADIGRGLKLRAEHQIQWSLDPKDRQLIHSWETLLSNTSLQRLTFDEFQTVLFAERTKSR